MQIFFWYDIIKFLISIELFKVKHEKIYKIFDFQFFLHFSKINLKMILRNLNLLKMIKMRRFLKPIRSLNLVMKILIGTSLINVLVVKVMAIGLLSAPLN